MRLRYEKIFYLLHTAVLITGCKQAKNESGKDIVTAKKHCTGKRLLNREVLLSVNKLTSKQIDKAVCLFRY